MRHGTAGQELETEDIPRSDDTDKTARVKQRFQTRTGSVRVLPPVGAISSGG
ncbi:hypothetical protein [Chroococcidiopsis sp. SAG 2025]|uniref:hypothetical protein n=1 Tax=Chroococcidiopsis sp. SAG 2025 TaxID=171389 RepID=UPI0029372393|nr:hypothetical protein [Chroococcidiopsis sp. SAG 2025]